jgi:hypothetical protein
MKHLTENQQELIAKITEEFMAINNYSKPTSFADVLISEVNETKREFEAIELKNQAVFQELKKQFEEDVAYLIKECEKLGIEIESALLQRGDASDYCGATIWFGKNQAYSERFTISAKVPSILRAKNGLRKYELYPELSYILQSTEYTAFSELIVSDSFKNCITRLYNVLNK